MLQKVTRLDSVPTAEETVLTTEVPTKESRLYTLPPEPRSCADLESFAKMGPTLTTFFFLLFFG